jgi:hypothetical protein
MTGSRRDCGSRVYRIEDAYVTHFDDLWGWRTMCWLNLTDKGD